MSFIFSLALCLSLCLFSEGLVTTAPATTTTTKTTTPATTTHKTTTPATTTTTTTKTTTPDPWTPYPLNDTCPRGLTSLLLNVVNGDRLVQGYQALRQQTDLSIAATNWTTTLEKRDKKVIGMSACYQPNVNTRGQAFCWCSTYTGDRDQGLPLANIEAEVRAGVRPRYGGQSSAQAVAYTAKQWKRTTGVGVGCGRSWDGSVRRNHICIAGFIDKPEL